MTRVSADRLETFARALLVAYGVSSRQAEAVARHCVWCELIGRPNFGLQRFPIHVKRLELGLINPAPVFVFERIGAAAAALDAQNAFGQFAAAAAMDYATGLAREAGIGCVAVRNSNFFGAGAFYVEMAAAKGMIGLAMSNSFPKVAPHGGRTAVFGTNPTALGAPRRNGESILFDLATSALAGSTVREHIEKGLALPPGLAIAADGQPITDPSQVNKGALLPFGGAKGSGLALFVEILAGVLSGAGVSHGVASMYEDFSRGGDNGHFLLAIDVSRFLGLDQFFDRIEGLIGLMKASGPEVLLPGEVRWRNFRENQAQGIALDMATRDAVGQLAAAKGAGTPW
jgi:ureidoglycolate dehydrogenase (NAD+)